mmetsp:Transcript_98925/g.262730  ORF Transcript_98925/g.262730 Transcript_98925/m.262730 type:complete len:261 (-) Transcript_98925:322-1104(-)
MEAGLEGLQLGRIVVCPVPIQPRVPSGASVLPHRAPKLRHDVRQGRVVPVEGMNVGPIPEVRLPSDHITPVQLWKIVEVYDLAVDLAMPSAEVAARDHREDDCLRLQGVQSPQELLIGKCRIGAKVHQTSVGTPIMPPVVLDLVDVIHKCIDKDDVCTFVMVGPVAVVGLQHEASTCENRGRRGRALRKVDQFNLALWEGLLQPVLEAARPGALLGVDWIHPRTLLAVRASSARSAKDNHLQRLTPLQLLHQRYQLLVGA